MVVIADDHMIVKDGFRFLLERQPDMEVAAKANGMTYLNHIDKDS